MNEKMNLPNQYFWYLISTVIHYSTYALKCYETLKNGTTVIDDSKLSPNWLVCVITKFGGRKYKGKGIGSGQSGWVCQNDSKNASEILCHCGTDLCNDKYPSGVLVEQNELICRSTTEDGDDEGKLMQEETTCKTNGTCIGAYQNITKYKMFFCYPWAVVGPKERCFIDQGRSNYLEYCYCGTSMCDAIQSVPVPTTSDSTAGTCNCSDITSSPCTDAPNKSLALNTTGATSWVLILWVLLKIDGSLFA